jgi:hypothetical protein
MLTLDILILVLAFCDLFLSSSPAAADVVDFILSRILGDGNAMSGTVDLDETNSVVASTDLTTSSPTDRGLFVSTGGGGMVGVLLIRLAG